MNKDKNKAIVEQFLTLTSAKNYDAAFELMDDDLIWWVAGDPSTCFGAGNKSKEQVCAELQQTASVSPTGMVMTIKSMIAEGDKVSVETEAHADFVNGDSYFNEFHLLFELHNEKIIHIKEYYDTLTATNTFTKLFSDLQADS